MRLQKTKQESRKTGGPQYSYNLTDPGVSPRG
jgi:hypothetical protein